jgi:aminopeptidase N
VGYTETGSLYIHDTVSEEFTLIREDAYAFPTLGEPSIARNRARERTPFTFDVRATVPAEFSVATGGVQLETTASAGARTFHFASTDPVPFLNIAIARYRLVERPGIRLWYLASDEKGAVVLLGRVAKALEALERWLGPAPPRPSLAIFEIPDGWGSQAGVVAGIMLSAAAFRDPTHLEEAYHELSHIWNAEDRDVPSPRWNEGLAMFFQRRIAEELGSPAQLDPAAERVARRLLDASAGDGVALAGVPLAEFGAKGLTDYAYSVGFLYFYVLDRAVGDAAFLHAMRDIYQSHKAPGITTAELTAALEARFPCVAAIDADWVRSTRWLERLRSGQTPAAIAAGYACR